MAVLIKNAMIYDGSGEAGFQGSIIIEEDKIKSVLKASNHQCYDEVNLTEIIDGTGMALCPGFIDTHSHSDLKVLEEPEVLPKLMQGITTEVLGQDGISMAPLPIEHIAAWRMNLAGLDGVSNRINWQYVNTEHYLDMIQEAKPAVNEAYLIPHGNVRMEVLGLDNVQPDREQLAQMCEVLRREMKAGGFGLSTGLIYVPCAYSETNELVELCKVVKEFDGVLVIHQRSEADTILDSMKEVIHIGEETGVRIHFSHFKVCGKNNWDKITPVLQLLDEAKAAGLEISYDQYPYVAGSTMLGVALPPWAHDGGTDQLMRRLRSKEEREKMKTDILNGIPGWDNFIDFAGFDQIFITSTLTEKNQQYIGKSLMELAQLQGKEPFDAMFDLLLEENNAVGIVDFYGTEEHVETFMKRDEMNVCTDGLLGGKPHPRVYGAFPRVLGKYVREQQILSLGAAVRKMTGKAAEAMHLENRGLLKEGYFADVVVFCPDTVIDQGTFTEPAQYPEGIEYVLVNGQVAVRNGKYAGVRSGHVLRH